VQTAGAGEGFSSVIVKNRRAWIRKVSLGKLCERQGKSWGWRKGIFVKVKPEGERRIYRK